MRLIKEANYAEEMRTIVEPYLSAFRTCGYTERVEGQPIYYEAYQVDDAKGVIVISHGFTESVAKYAESIYYMLQEGYNVFMQDHRGHGKSYRHNENPLVVHVEHFSDYVEDLKFFVNTVVKPESGDMPVYLYCHSMGGCVGAWIIEEEPELFDKAILSSPMLGINFGAAPEVVIKMFAQLIKLSGKGAEPQKPVTEFAAEPDFEHSCDSNEERYLYYHNLRLAHPEYQTTAPSVNWGLESAKACKRVTEEKNCKKVKIPVMLFQAGADDVVRNEDEDLFDKQTPSCTLVLVPGIKHEIYMAESSVLATYWNQIFDFLG